MAFPRGLACYDRGMHKPPLMARISEKLALGWMFIPMLLFIPFFLSQAGHWLGTVLWLVIALWIGLPLGWLVWCFFRSKAARVPAAAAPGVSDSEPVKPYPLDDMMGK